MIGPVGFGGGGPSRLRPAVTITGGGGQPVLAFQSEWDTATGTSTSAVQDGGTWGLFNGSGLLTVIAATSGFPTTNVLRVGANGTASHQIDFDLGAAPSVGSSLWYRCYLKYVSTSNDLGAQHFIQPDSTYTHPWNWRWTTPRGGTAVGLEWALIDRLNNSQFSGSLFEVELTIGTVYRLEYELRRTATGSFKMYPRIYLGDSETITFDSDDFLDSYSGSGTEGQSLTTLDTAIPNVNLNTDMTTVELGNNGPSGASSVVTDYWQTAAWAVSTEDWIGPYVEGESV